MVPIAPLSHFYGWLETAEFTAQSCSNCLTVLLRKVTFLYPGTMWVTNYCCDYDAVKILSFGHWILSVIFHRSDFYLCGYKETNSQFRFNDETLPCLSKLTMLQLAWLQGHKYTAPPSVMLGWLVLAFGAPIKILILDGREENTILHCGKTLGPGKVQYHTKKWVFWSKNQIYLTYPINMSNMLME